MLCCPLLLALPSVSDNYGNVNTKIQKNLQNFNMQMPSSHSLKNQHNLSKKLQIPVYSQTVIMSPSNLRSLNHGGVLFAPTRSIFDNRINNNIEHNPKFFNRRSTNQKVNNNNNKVGFLMNGNFVRNSNSFDTIQNNNNAANNYGVNNIGINDYSYIHDYNNYGLPLSLLKHKRSLFNNKINKF